LALKPEQVVVKGNSAVDFGSGPVERQDQLLFIGRLTPEKGIETLLDAAEKANLNLHIIGDGPLRSLVEQRASLCSSITYAGFSTPKEVAAALQRTRALVIASTSYEGMPLVVLEAFAAGTPVIALRLGGLGEIVQHEVNGLHFKLGSVEDLIAQARRLMEDPELAIKLGQNARASYEAHYSPERNYQQLVAIYEAVILERAVTSKQQKVLQ
jgi:glycosyltransferase involved in cell wall biosynthesis